ncbi:MAG TPA: hypothetical protein VGB83_06300 [Actinomycetota bacterium]
MKPSGLSKPVLVSSVLATFLTSCGFFTVPNEVDIVRVGVDLTFGGDTIEIDQPVLPPIALPSIEIPEFPEPEPEPTTPEEPLCGPTTAIAPRDAATANISQANIPSQGTYLFQFQGNRENGFPFFDVGYRTIGNIVEATEPDGSPSFRFEIEDPIDYFSGEPLGRRITYKVVPSTGADNPTEGLFLTKIEFTNYEPFRDPDEGPARYLAFEPAKPLKLIDFTIEQGATSTDAAADVAPKSESGQTDPLSGAPILVPSSNTIQSDTEILGRDRITVCEELAQAYKISWKLEISGEYELEMFGLFWVATQYGGWSVKEQYTVIGDVFAGNYDTNLMKIDPGDYL